MARQASAQGTAARRAAPASADHQPSPLPTCLSLDLEVRRGRIHAFGAVRSDSGEGVSHAGAGVIAALGQLDEIARGASFLLGHNLIAFDLPHLAKAKPELKLLRLPAVDTLRLSPLAYPRNPYHSLVKHYQDAGLKRTRRNDPELDSRITLDLFQDELKTLAAAPEELLAAWHWLCAREPRGKDRAVDALFTRLRRMGRPSKEKAAPAIEKRLAGAACAKEAVSVAADAERYGWGLAYVLSWLRVAGGNSVMPPWVRHQFPVAQKLVRRLRDAPCKDEGCEWCRERHDARKCLKRWFGFPDFRSKPVDEQGSSLQRLITEEAMAGRHVLGILPTGAGKSICYQLPALARYERTGALTVVISPLVALMADQVSGMQRHGIGCCYAINGLLSLPERYAALERVRLGDAGILLVSPEQLRSSPLRRALKQREIGGWVMDEAHCLSRWGHDFRPDYRYVGRFIREKADGGPPPPVLCLTATAKPDVIEDIEGHFRENLGIELAVYNGGTKRENLVFEVVPAKGKDKFALILEQLASRLPPETPGGAIVYCATRGHSEAVADYLNANEIFAAYFHAKMSPEAKKEVQRSFVQGELRAIAATNAFGMGIDKPDARLIVHADIPGSLENYLQEAGRAGRDGEPAHCVLIYDEDDIEQQFRLLAMSKLTRAKIQGVLRAVRNLNRKNRFRGEVVATPGEILLEGDARLSDQDSEGNASRVRTAVAWLEEAKLLSREENVVNLFPSSLRVRSSKEAEQRLIAAQLESGYRDKLLGIANVLIGSNPDTLVTTDDLMLASGLKPDEVRDALFELEKHGIASNDVVLTAFVHAGVARSSNARLRSAMELETGLIDRMRLAAPGLGPGESSFLQLRAAAQALRSQGLVHPLPERVFRVVQGIQFDGRGEAGSAKGSLTVRKRGPETVKVTLHREWDELARIAAVRRDAAACLLKHLLDGLPRGVRGTDLLAETTFGKLLGAIKEDMILMSRTRHPNKLLNRALLWLHDQGAIRLNKGLQVLRPAMKLRLNGTKRRGYTRKDFEPLWMHYESQALRVHVAAEYATRGLDDAAEAQRLAADYFELGEKDFLARWFAGRKNEISRWTTPASWREIVQSLNNPAQEKIVADARDRTNVLVLAGPGSGKTRVLVHRIAWLVRVRREDPRSILGLAYNRHAAVQIRRRLASLIGRDARFVQVLTCHALAMRLAGESFAGQSARPDTGDFNRVMRRATSVLAGGDLMPEEADARRARLLAGFRWILVDEYQDVNSEQYALISALAGRSLEDGAGKLTLFAVGDDDQNIYSFSGASATFIRRFEKDYGPKPAYLVQNYRSTGHIVAAANAVIGPAKGRLKRERPIQVDAARAKEALGGAWVELDPISRGRVRVIPVDADPLRQARAVMAEFERLSALTPDWRWDRCAVIARAWKYLDPVYAYCKASGIPAQRADEEAPHFWRLRETRAFLRWLRNLDPQVVNARALSAWLSARPSDQWHDLLRQAAREHSEEMGERAVPVSQFIEWLAEWGREVRRRQQGLLLLTAHRAKGLEFDHVAVLAGGWALRGAGEDADAPRRLYYVAMTRAEKTLALASLRNAKSLQGPLAGHPSVTRLASASMPPCARGAARLYRRLKLEEIDLGFSGRLPVYHPARAAIRSLSVGDPLRARESHGGVWELLDEERRVVGRLAKKFQPPPRTQCLSAKVHAVVRWSRELSDPKYHPRIRTDVWETVIPELVFEPAEESQ